MKLQRSSRIFRASLKVHTDGDTLQSVTCEIPRDEAPDRVFIRMGVETE